METILTSRRPAVAGRFYPDDPAALRAMVTQYCNAPSRWKSISQNRELLALMLPHAGYVFSGPVAGAALSGVPIPDRVILLGPNHTGRGAPLAVWNAGPWLTPLGAVPMDTDAATALLNAGTGYTGDTAAHLAEHSLEVLLPFLQVLNPSVRVTPIAVSSLAPALMRAAGEALESVIADAAAAGDRILLIVSSDMSHYLPQAETEVRDAMALEALKTLDPDRLLAVVREHGITMCGVVPMALALVALAGLGAMGAEVLGYATSGQTGRAFGAGMDKVVGYAGVALLR